MAFDITISNEQDCPRLYWSELNPKWQAIYPKPGQDLDARFVLYDGEVYDMADFGSPRGCPADLPQRWDEAFRIALDTWLLLDTSDDDRCRMATCRIVSAKATT
jgi:hypothetical protein